MRFADAKPGGLEEAAAAAETALGAALRTVVKRAAWVARYRYLASALRRASRRTEPAVADRRSVARSAPSERSDVRFRVTDRESVKDPLVLKI